MVKENTVAGEEIIGFTVIDGDPVRVKLGCGIRRARVKGGLFRLGRLLNLAVELGGRGLIEPRLLLQAQDADGFQDAQRPEPIGVGLFWG